MLRLRFRLWTLMIAVAALAVGLTAVVYTRRLATMREEEKMLFLVVLLIILFLAAALAILGLIYAIASWLERDERRSAGDPPDSRPSPSADPRSGGGSS